MKRKCGFIVTALTLFICSTSVGAEQELLTSATECVNGVKEHCTREGDAGDQQLLMQMRVGVERNELSIPEPAKSFLEEDLGAFDESHYLAFDEKQSFAANEADHEKYDDGDADEEDVEEGLIEEDAREDEHEGFALGDMCSHFSWDHGKVCRNSDGKLNNNGNCNPPMYWDVGNDTSKPVNTGPTEKELNDGFGKPACGEGIHQSQKPGCKTCSPPQGGDAYRKAMGYQFRDETGQICAPVCVNRVHHQSYRKVMAGGLGMYQKYVALKNGNSSCRKPKRNCNYNDHTRKAFYSSVGLGRRCNPSFDTKVFDTCADDPTKAENCQVQAKGKTWNVLNACFDDVWDKTCKKHKCFMLKSQEPSLFQENSSLRDVVAGEAEDDEDAEEEEEQEEEEEEKEEDDEEDNEEEEQDGDDHGDIEALLQPNEAKKQCMGWCDKGWSAKRGWFDVIKGQGVPKCAWFKCNGCSACASPPSKCLAWCATAQKKGGGALSRACHSDFEGCKDCGFCGGSTTAAPTQAPAPSPGPSGPSAPPALPTPASAPTPAPTPAPPSPPSSRSPPSPPGKCIATCKTYNSADPYGIGASCDDIYKANGCPMPSPGGGGGGNKRRRR